MTWRFQLLNRPWGGVTEGPVWDGEAVYYTHIPTSRILRCDPKTAEITQWRGDTNRTNGLCYDAQGRLFGCCSGGRAIVRFDADGSIATVADRLDGQQLNTPNDLAVDRRGRIWFTNPWNAGNIDDTEIEELDHRSVLRADPQEDGSYRVARAFSCPESLAFSRHLWYTISIKQIGNGAMTATKNAPGKSYRKGITLIEAVEYFGNDALAEAWFVERRWPDGIRCPYCASDAVTSRKGNRQTPQYHCTNCKGNFTVKTGTIMHDSKLSLGKWALAFYLYSTNLKGVSSMKLHRDLGITQKSAWHLAHRIRETWDDATERFAGPVEADESYFGGKEPNKHKAKKLNAGRGMVGKTGVVGVKDRATNQIVAQVIPSPTKAVLHDFIEQTVEDTATVYTDEWAGYNNLPRKHHVVRHSVGEYVREQAHSNGMESFWAMMKRGFTGTYHQMSPKHLDRYVNEFEGRHNQRPMDTADQMAAMVRGSDGKRLQYQELIGAEDTRMGKGMG